MKRGAVFLFLCLVSLSFVSGAVNVHKVSLKQEYFPYEIISGKINLTISDEKLVSNLSCSLGQSISLKDFLDSNSAKYSCSNYDCSDDYNYSGKGTEKTFGVVSQQKKYFGFVLFGKNMNINDISFGISSNFGEESSVPLKMKFFGRSSWEFNDVSSSFGAEKYGCYDLTKGSADPYIRGLYCEEIFIPTASKIAVGAIVSGSDTKQLKMSVYGNDLRLKSSCNFNPSTGGNSCIIEDNFEGKYYICVGPHESENSLAYTYKLFSESDGGVCGWYGLPSTENSTKDYGIFVKTAKYASATPMTINKNSDSLSNLISDANLFIQAKYNRDCSDGCVLPVEVSGVSQNLIVSNVNIAYSSGGDYDEYSVYDVSAVSPTLDFSGVLELSSTGFDVGGKGEKNFRLSLDDDEFLDEEIKVLPAPVIKNVYPQNPAAAVSVTFTADVESDNNVSSYFWDFGDGETKTTTRNFVSHAYSALGSYTLILNVSDSAGLTSSKSFSIIAGSPKGIINETLSKKKNALDNAIRDINKFPAWQHDVLEKISEIGFYQDELKRLEKEKENAFTDDDFLNVALKIQALDVPRYVVVSEEMTLPFFTDLNEIDPEPIAMIGGGVSNDEDLSGYKNPILQWQIQNIDGTIMNKKISVVRENTGSKIELSVYEINVKSNSEDESYLVIKKPLDSLFFNGGYDERRAGSSTVVIFDANEEKNLKFYIEGGEEAVFYVSSKLSLLPVEAEVGECNFNKICEKNLGENYENCRSDCKPWLKMIIYIILILIFGLVVYTLLQMWYKARYEKFLFKDRRHLFNLLMFINNAQARGISDDRIKKQLKEHKWKKEQIIYALKKSHGKTTGMYDIIPVEKLFAWLRMKSAKLKKAAPQPTPQPFSYPSVGYNN